MGISGLMGFRLVDDPRCECGEAEESVEHVLFDCMRYESQRIILWGEVDRLSLVRDRKVLVREEEIFIKFKTFVKEVLVSKEGREQGGG